MTPMASSLLLIMGAHIIARMRKSTTLCAISSRSSAAASLLITGVDDVNQLVKQGQNLYRHTGATGTDPTTVQVEPDRRTVRPGYVEASGVDPIKTLLQLTSASKAVTSNSNMIRYHDLLLDRAVNVLGRVSS